MILLWLASAGVQAGPLQVPGPVLVPSISAPVTLPAGLPVRLTTRVAISSRGLVQGRRIPLALAEDVVVAGRVVLPAGTPAVGEIEALSEKGMFGKAAKFTLQPLFVDTRGQRINLAGRHDRSGAKGVAAAAVVTVLAGTFGLLITGKNAELPASSELLAEIRNDTPVP